MKYSLFFLSFFIVLNIIGCKEAENPIDTSFSSKVLNMDKKLIEEIEQVDIYAISEEEEYGFYTPIDKLIEHKQILITLKKKEIKKLFEALKMNVGSKKGCFSSRSSETLHYIIRRKSTTSIGYFISNSCGIKRWDSTFVRYLHSNGETGVAFSRELFMLLIDLTRKPAR